MLQQAKHRAKKSGVPFNLTEADVSIPTHCPALGIPLYPAEQTVGPNSPSLDRIRPELGYTRGNVIVLSHRANTIKQNASSEELLAVAHWLAGLGA
jgi:hypothetical protein